MRHKLVIVVGLGLLAWAVLLAGEKTDPPARAGQAPGREAKTPPAPGAPPPRVAAGGPDPVRAKGSYCLGLVLGRDIKKQKLNVQIDRFLHGVKDGMVGAKTKMTEEEINKAIAAFQDQRFKHLAAENLKKSKAFLARTRKIDGVKATRSGLQYLVLRAGWGKQPKITDTVTVHYRAMHIDGTVFDSSYARGQPDAVAVAEAIRGWGEGLQLMKEGGKWKLFIPPELAYGKEGQGDAVGPNCAIVVEVELINIK